MITTRPRMTTNFSTNAKRRNSPAWCKPGMFTGVEEFHDGLPIVLNAYARWLDDYSTVPINLVETIHLRRTTLFDGWQGGSSNVHYNLNLIVLNTHDNVTFDVTLQVRLGTSVLNSYTWIHHQPPQHTRFDSGHRYHVHTPHHQLSECRVMG